MSFRPATPDDAMLLLAWRNRDENTVGYPHHTSLDAHQAWLNQRLANPLIKLLIWETHGWPTGTIRIDSNGELAYHADTDTDAHQMLTATLHHAHQYGGRLKATLDTDDPKTVQLERAGFQVYPSTFLAYKP